MATKKKRPPLGSGKRFASLAKKVGSKALAAWIGRKAHPTTFNKMAAAGRRRAAKKK
jgi:hypothetical protein